MQSAVKSIAILIGIIILVSAAVYFLGKTTQQRYFKKFAAIQVKTKEDFLEKMFGFSFNTTKLPGLACYKNRPIGPDKSTPEINNYFVCETERTAPYGAVGWFNTRAEYVDIQRNMANSLLQFSGGGEGNYVCREDTEWTRSNMNTQMRQQLADCVVTNNMTGNKIRFSVYYIFPLMDKKIGNYILVSDLGKPGHDVAGLVREAAKTVTNKASISSYLTIEKAYAYSGGDASCTAAAAAASTGTGCAPGDTAGGPNDIITESAHEPAVVPSGCGAGTLNDTCPLPSGCGAGTLNDTCPLPSGCGGGTLNDTCPSTACTETSDGGSYNDGCAVVTWSAVYTTCGNSTTESKNTSRDESGCSVTLTTPDPAPVVPNACDSADASLYCSTTCCTTSSGDEKCGSKDCSVTTTTVTTPTPPTVPNTPTPLPSGCGPGTLNDDCYVPYPDLSAGSVTPARVTPDVSATFSTTISNIGDDTTGTWFYNFFQIATEVNGGGTVTDLLATSMNALAPGRSNTVSTSYTFSKGIYSIRACADKSNRSNSGRISESNEGNNCGPWTRLVVKDPPEIQNVGMEFPDISFVCINSETYTATHEESGEVIGQGSTIDGELILAKFSEEGNYSLKCLSDPLSARAVVNYTIPEIVLSGLSISANPRTVNNNKSTTVSWSVLNPRPVCSLRAEVLCSDSCSADQLAASSSLNATLKNGTTDANDQYGGGRNIQTAVQKVYTKYSNKAMGKKTLPMSYTTDFVLDCGKSSDGKSLLKKIRIMVAGENEG